MDKIKRKKNVISTAVSTAFGLIVYFLIKQFIFTTPSFDKSMMQAASKLNESCPIMVDQATRLDNAQAQSSDIFLYNFTLVNTIKDSIDIEYFTNYMEPMILNNIKTNPDLKIFRDNEITFAYNYNDKNGVFITKISITADQYKLKE